MKGKKKARRGAATHNGADNQVRNIVPHRKIRNKAHVALLRGSLLGAGLATIGGVLYMETHLLEGALTAVIGCVWLLIFYLVNSDDPIYGG